MIFVSKGYFQSKNCLREVDASVSQDKPICLMFDPVRGGASLPDLKAECRDELRRTVFDGREVIVWHRIKDFQLITLKLLAEQLLLGCPPHLGKASMPVFVPGELTRSKLAFPGPVRLYTSPNNPGASAVAARLCDGMVGVKLTDVPPRQSSRRDAADAAGELADTASELAGAASELAGSVAAGIGTDRRRYTFTPCVQRNTTPSDDRPASGTMRNLLSATGLRSAKEAATHMLLYLNHDTFVGAEGEALAAEVRAARAADFNIVMLHENDEVLGGCPFAKLFETTPQASAPLLSPARSFAAVPLP